MQTLIAKHWTEVVDQMGELADGLHIGNHIGRTTVSIPMSLPESETLKSIQGLVRGPICSTYVAEDDLICPQWERMDLIL